MCVKIEGKSFSCWGETKRRPMFLVFPSRWRRFNFHTIIGAISIDYKEVSTCRYWTEWFGFNTPSLLCSRIIHCTICMGFNLQPKTKCWKLSKIVQNVIIIRLFNRLFNYHQNENFNYCVKMKCSYKHPSSHKGRMNLVSFNATLFLKS